MYESLSSDAIRHPIPSGAYLPSNDAARGGMDNAKTGIVVTGAIIGTVVTAPTVAALSGRAFWSIAAWGSQPQNQLLVAEGATFTAGVLNPGPEDISPGSGSDELGRYTRQVIGKIPGFTKTSEAIKAMKPCGCFTDTTLVLTQAGYKEISTIVSGDSVMAYDYSTGTTAWKKVIQVFETDWNEIVSIYVSGAVINTTNEHPFYLKNRWKKAIDLVVGDTLTSLLQGTPILIDSIKFSEGTFKVYNILVDQYHTFYVSNDNILVHNGVPCPVSFQKLAGILGGDWVSKKIDADVIVGKIKTEISFRLSEDGASIVVRNVFNNLKAKDAKKAVEYGELFLQNANNRANLMDIAKKALTSDKVTAADKVELNKMIDILTPKQ